jgi:hypothetical protein
MIVFMSIYFTTKFFFRNCDLKQIDAIVQFPFVRAPASNYDTMFTSLKFVSDQLEILPSQTRAFITFDQPLFIKAVDIVRACEDTMPAFKNIIPRLGGFHTLMSFLACIGYLMAGTGLGDLLSTIYARNSVDHMLSGKAYARAVRGHILLQKAIVVCDMQNNFSNYLLI